MDSVIHNRKNIYHTIIHFNNILIIKRISMIDSSKKNVSIILLLGKRLGDAIFSILIFPFSFAS